MCGTRILRISDPPISDATYPLFCFDCGTIAFRDFITSPALIFSSPRIPICRFPMHVRALSFTSPLPRRSIEYREITISNAAIPLYAESLKCRTPILQLTILGVTSHVSPLRSTTLILSKNCGSRFLPARVLCLWKLRFSNEPGPDDSLTPSMLVGA
jgi:hypothetical protein